MSVFGGHEGMSFEDFAEQALADAGLDYSAIGMAFCGHAMQGFGGTSSAHIFSA
jgi:hypothetical protein